jgi:ribosomal protein L11 methylase PrmA
MSTHHTIHPSSYRDPSGFIFQKDGVVYRQVNQSFKDDFSHFIDSGCYAQLTAQQLLIPHTVIPENLTGDAEWHATLKPEPIPFWSYPYEWSFDMLKDAALLTLRLQKEAMKYGCILKDATPYNIQWHKGRMVFIDTLSFERYRPEEPWIAYRQFCGQFLSPLLLMHYDKIPLQQVLLAWPEGIPVALTRKLLPWRSRFSLHTWLHIHLHASVSAKNRTGSKPVVFSEKKMRNVVSSLEGLIGKLRLPAQPSAWSDYYEEVEQRNDYLGQKIKIISDWLKSLHGIHTAIDLGANDGAFSKLAAGKNIFTLAIDADPVCINNLYLSIRNRQPGLVHPLVMDLANPSPSIGVNNKERSAFTGRARADISLALALIHHLSIARNIPFPLVVSFLASLSPYLIIEFVPKEDEKVKQLLQHKKDIYTRYDHVHFEEAFAKHYRITEKKMIPGSGRTLYLMLRHEK